MGNNPSSDGAHASRPVRAFGRSTGVLGLSKSELERRCKPSGLYPSCQWEEKAIRRQIGDGKLAARLTGSESRSSVVDRECPICFLHYGETNVTKCCQAHICTECYLQVRPQKEKNSACPFCNNNKLQVSVAKRMGAEELQAREQEEQRVIEAQIRSRAATIDVPSPSTTTTTGAQAKESPPPSPAKEFGASLEQNSRIARLRARSESFSEDSLRRSTEDISVSSVAMTPEERRELENEMKAQHFHPLALQVEAEAAERRLQNQREYYRTLSGRLRETARSQRADIVRSHSTANALGPRTARPTNVPMEAMAGARRGGRDWNQIVDAFEQGGNGEVNSLDDLVVLEAAILLSMEEEARRTGQPAQGGPPGSAAHAAAAAAPAPAGLAAPDDFDAARHARDGFPLVQAFLSSRSSSGGSNNGESESNVPDMSNNNRVQALVSNLSNRRRNTVLRGHRAMSTSAIHTAYDTASLLIRGVSEEEQVAMAIAASLQEQPQTGSSPAGPSDTGSADGMDQVVANPSESPALASSGADGLVVGIAQAPLSRPDAEQDFMSPPPAASAHADISNTGAAGTSRDDAE